MILSFTVGNRQVNIDLDFWTIGEPTPCGKPVLCAEMSTWKGYGRPDPLGGKCGNIHLEPIYENEELAYFVAQAPSGVYLRLWND